MSENLKISQFSVRYSDETTEIAEIQIPVSAVTDLNNELNNKFDKTGGTISGDVTIKGDLELEGGYVYAGNHSFGDDGIWNGDYLISLPEKDGTIALQEDVDITIASATNKLKEDIEIIEHVVLPQTGILVSDDIAEAYDTRITAQGRDIIDGHKAELKKVEGSSVACKNLFNFDELIGNNLNASVAPNINYEKESIALPPSANLYIIGVSFEDRAFETFNKVLNITEAGIYCLRVKVTDQNGNSLQNARMRSSWTLNTATNDSSISSDSMDIDGLYYFTKFNITQEKLDLIKTGDNDVFRLYIYTACDKTTMENIDCIVSEFTFCKGDYTLAAMPQYTPYFTGLKSASFGGIKSIGRNLIPYTYDDKNKTVTISGITFTTNYDGSITLNGTATNYAGFNLADKNSLKLKVGETYTLSGGGEVIFAYKDENGKTQYISSGKANNSIAFEWKEGYEVASLYLQVDPGNAVNNKTIYPMLNYGTTALSYEPYRVETFSFLEIEEMPLGKTIDFENKKIIDNGYTIELNGTEGWGLSFGPLGEETYSQDYFNHPTFVCAEKLVNKEERLQNAIVSQGHLSSDAWSEGSWWLGVNSTAVYWVGAANFLGLRTWPYSTGNQEEDRKIAEAVTPEQRQAVIDGFKAHLQEHPIYIRYIPSLATPHEEKSISLSSNEYQVFNQGSETILNENSQYGVKPTVTINYLIKIGG